MSGEWNGAETESSSARFAPAALSSSQALSTPALLPAMTVWLRIVEAAAAGDDLAGQLRRRQRRSRHAPLRRRGSDRRHRARTDRNRLPHRLGAETNQRQGFGQAQHAGDDKRGVFAE